VAVADVTAVRAVRGAIQVDRDDAEVILADSGALLAEVIRRNDLAAEDIISVVFTTTPDLASGFPAAAARVLVLPTCPCCAPPRSGCRTGWSG
jgi:chorismate mutase